MVSGRQTLGSIERTLGELRQEETAMKRAVETAMADIADLRRAELDAYRELARFRLRDGGEHAFGQRIDRDEAEARKRLEQRGLALSDLRAQHAALEAEVASLTDERR